MASQALQRGKSTPHLVLESLPEVGEDGETQLLHSMEMEHLAKMFSETREVEVPKCPTVACLIILIWSFCRWAYFTLVMSHTPFQENLLFFMWNLWLPPALILFLMLFASSSGIASGSAKIEV